MRLEVLPVNRVTVLIVALATSWLAAGVARSAGPVVGWGNDAFGAATPPPAVNGTAGTGAVAAPPDGSASPRSSALTRHHGCFSMGRRWQRDGNDFVARR